MHNDQLDQFLWQLGNPIVISHLPQRFWTISFFIGFPIQGTQQVVGIGKYSPQTIKFLVSEVWGETKLLASVLENYGESETRNWPLWDLSVESADQTNLCLWQLQVDWCPLKTPKKMRRIDLILYRESNNSLSDLVQQDPKAIQLVNPIQKHTDSTKIQEGLLFQQEAKEGYNWNGMRKRPTSLNQSDWNLSKNPAKVLIYLLSRKMLIFKNYNRVWEI